eukprot:Skav229300  [mRNA]  locus=scaffold544:245744:256277:+ [translate_table: standard]
MAIQIFRRRPRPASLRWLRQSADAPALQESVELGILQPPTSDIETPQGEDSTYLPHPATSQDRSNDINGIVARRDREVSERREAELIPQRDEAAMAAVAQDLVMMQKVIEFGDEFIHGLLNMKDEEDDPRPLPEELPEPEVVPVTDRFLEKRANAMLGPGKEVADRQAGADAAALSVAQLRALKAQGRAEDRLSVQQDLLGASSVGRVLALCSTEESAAQHQAGMVKGLANGWGDMVDRC